MIRCLWARPVPPPRPQTPARPPCSGTRTIETLDRAALERLQLQRLQETVRRVAAHVPFYQQKFAELGVKPE